GRPGLLPDVHARQPVRGPVHGAGPTRPGRPGRRLPPRRVRPAQGVAERKSAPPGPALPGRRFVPARDGKAVEPQTVVELSEEKVCPSLWDLTGTIAVQDLLPFPSSMLI